MHLTHLALGGGLIKPAAAVVLDLKDPRRPANLLCTRRDLTRADCSVYIVGAVREEHAVHLG